MTTAEAIIAAVCICVLAAVVDRLHAWVFWRWLDTQENVAADDRGVRLENDRG